MYNIIRKIEEDEMKTLAQVEREIEEIVNRIEKMDWVGRIRDVWNHRHELWDDEDGTCYDIVYDMETGKVIMICTVDYYDKELIPIDVLYED